MEFIIKQLIKNQRKKYGIDTQVGNRHFPDYRKDEDKNGCHDLIAKYEMWVFAEIISRPVNVDR